MDLTDKLFACVTANQLTAWTTGVLFQEGAGNGIFSLRHPCVQACSGAHPTSYAMDIRVSFPGVKEAGT